MPSSRTISEKSKKTVLIKTTGHEKTRFTIVLTCIADGTPLKLMVIFKCKTIPKGNFPTNMVLHVHPKGWMDEEGIKLWICKVWAARPGGLGQKQSLLVLREDHNTHVSVIPGGLTSLVQPLDVCLNKPFKDRLRRLWTDWMMSGEMSYRAGGNIRAALLTTVVEWV